MYGCDYARHRRNTRPLSTRCSKGMRDIDRYHRVWCARDSARNINYVNYTDRTLIIYFFCCCFIALCFTSILLYLCYLFMQYIYIRLSRWTCCWLVINKMRIKQLIIFFRLLIIIFIWKFVLKQIWFEGPIAGATFHVLFTFLYHTILYYTGKGLGRKERYLVLDKW
jgi:hypothetical protein